MCKLLPQKNFLNDFGSCSCDCTMVLKGHSTLSASGFSIKDRELICQDSQPMGSTLDFLAKRLTNIPVWKNDVLQLNWSGLGCLNHQHTIADPCQYIFSFSLQMSNTIRSIIQSQAHGIVIRLYLESGISQSSQLISQPSYISVKYSYVVCQWWIVLLLSCQLLI